MEIKLLNLNIFNYNNFEERKQKIVAFVKQENPDVIALQEVRDDYRFNDPGNHQAKQLNKLIKYPYMQYLPVMKKQGEKYPKPCWEGLAILSKYPIIHTESISQTKFLGDKYDRKILHAKINMQSQVDFFVVHYSIGEQIPLLCLQETLEIAKEKAISPIIMGDFNITNPEKVSSITKNNFIAATDVHNYISHEEYGGPVDNVLIPKQYTFVDVACKGEGLSDHKALLATVKIVSSK